MNSFWLIVNGRIEEEYPTEAEALDRAHAWMEEMRLEAQRCGEWPDDTDVAVVRVLHRTELVPQGREGFCTLVLREEGRDE